MVFAIFLIVFSSFAFAQLELPENIQKIKEYNKEYIGNFALNISFFIVFIYNT